MTECRERQSSCFCILPKGHETPHVCDCGGSYQRRGDDLHVYALPPGPPECMWHQPLTQEEAMASANQYARSEPVLIEPWTPPFQVFRTSRRPIEFLRVPMPTELERLADRHSHD